MRLHVVFLCPVQLSGELVKCTPPLDQPFLVVAEFLLQARNEFQLGRLFATQALCIVQCHAGLRQLSHKACAVLVQLGQFLLLGGGGLLVLANICLQLLHLLFMPALLLVARRPSVPQTLG